MKTLVVITFFNESKYLRKNIESFLGQSRSVDKIIYIDDNSTDGSYEIIDNIQATSENLNLYKFKSYNSREPGKKIINAFNFGLSKVNIEDYDLLGKFDSDIILPKNYFESLIKEFENNKRLGIASGSLFVLKENKWIFESISDKNKVRGPIKLYRTQSFKEIGGLRNCIGWDTIDQLLINYYGWEAKVLVDLKVMHLRPTGSEYKSKHAMNFGKSLHNMRYDFLLAFISCLKMGKYHSSIKYFINSYYWYLKSSVLSDKNILTYEQGRFVRNYRWKQIRRKLIP